MFKKSYGFGRPLKERKLTYRFVGKDFMTSGGGLFECLQTGKIVHRKIKIAAPTKRHNKFSQAVSNNLNDSVARFYGVV